MGTNLNALLKTLNTIVLWCTGGVRGRIQFVPDDAERHYCLSDSCTSDRCCISSPEYFQPRGLGKVLMKFWNPNGRMRLLCLVKLYWIFFPYIFQSISNQTKMIRIYHTVTGRIWTQSEYILFDQKRLPNFRIWIVRDNQNFTFSATWFPSPFPSTPCLIKPLGLTIYIHSITHREILSN